MDISLFTAAVSSINAAREIGRAAIAVRDFNQFAAVVAQINDQLLKAQDSLFAHNAQLLALQNEVFESREQLRKMQETLAQRGKYALIELGKGQFVYRSRADAIPMTSGTGDPAFTEPEHHICQICFDKHGIKSVLQRRVWMGGAVSLDCTNCKDSVPTGEIDPN